MRARLVDDLLAFLLLGVGNKIEVFASFEHKLVSSRANRALLLKDDLLCGLGLQIHADMTRVIGTLKRSWFRVGVQVRVRIL